MIELRPLETVDLPAVLALNQSALEGVGDLDVARLAWIVELARQALVAEVDGRLAGFVITLGPGTDYDSVNYLWFAERYAEWTYLDRIVVADAFRRRGVASALYDAVERARPVALEVYSTPPNEPSLAFHARRGYVAVGELPQADGTICTMFLLR